MSTYQAHPITGSFPPSEARVPDSINQTCLLPAILTTFSCPYFPSYMVHLIVTKLSFDANIYALLIVSPIRRLWLYRQNIIIDS